MGKQLFSTTKIVPDLKFNIFLRDFDNKKKTTKNGKMCKWYKLH